MYKYIKQSPSANGGGSRHPLLKLLFAACIIAFAASILAVSCGKTAGGGNNNNNSGNNGGNNEPPLVPTTNLVLTNSLSAGLVKLNDNTATVRADLLTAAGYTAVSSANDSDRGYVDANSKRERLFNIAYPGAKAAIILVSRTHVTKDTISVKAATTTECSSSESGDNALASAADGGHCRQYTTGGNSMYFYSYLGTVFDNTNTANRARGILASEAALYYSDGRDLSVITDATAFNDEGFTEIWMAKLNSAGSAVGAEIDDAWVGDSASVKEVELYAIGIDVSDKTIEEFSGLKKAEFDKGLDNAAFKKMLRNNKWGELKFKVKLVTRAQFTALP